MTASTTCSCTNSPTDQFGDNDAGLAGQEPCDLFPIEMVPGVSIMGSSQPGTGKRPRIALNEFWDGTERRYDWPDNEPRAFFIAAQGASLVGLELDGSMYVHKDETLSRVIGVAVHDVQNFTVHDCVLNDLYNGIEVGEIVVESGSPTPYLTSATITNCVFTGSFPGFKPTILTGNFPADHDRGHAGLWLTVHHGGSSLTNRSTIEVAIDGCIFERNHDALETEILPQLGQPTPPGSRTSSSRSAS